MLDLERVVYFSIKHSTGEVGWDDWSSVIVQIKPIFHCNAKPLALGPRIGLDPQHDVTYTNMLVSKMPMPGLVDPMPGLADPTSGLGHPRVGAHVGHAHFILFVSISFTLGSQRKN